MLICDTAIPVIVVGSLLILGVLYGLIRCCCVKRNRNRTPASAAYASRRSRRNNRAQNNIPPPPMGQMQPPRPSTNTSQMSFANQGENPARNSYVPTPGAPDLPPPTYSSASPTYSRYSYQPPFGGSPAFGNQNAPSPGAMPQTGYTPSQPSPVSNPARNSGPPSHWVDPAQYNGANYRE